MLCFFFLSFFQVIRKSWYVKKWRGHWIIIEAAGHQREKVNIEQNIISSWLRVYPWVQVTSFETQTHTQTLHILFSFFRQDILVVLVYFAEFLGNEKENIKNKDSQWRIRFSPFVITVSRRASSLWKEDDLWNLPSSSLYSFVDDIITPSDSCRVCWCFPSLPSVSVLLIPQIRSSDSWQKSFNSRWRGNNTRRIRRSENLLLCV